MRSRLDKRRLASQEQLKEEGSCPSIHAAAHRGSNHLSYFVDHKRGASLAHQKRLGKPSAGLNENPDDLFNELAKIRQV